MNDEASTDTLGLVSLICGVLAVVFSLLQFMCIPFVGMLAPPLAIVSVVLGVIGMQQNANSTMSKAGTGVGCVAGIIQIVFYGCIFGGLGVYMLGVFAWVLAGA